MLRGKKIKFIVSCLFVLLALWVATPKVYIHALLHHDHSSYSLSTETRVKSQAAEDCDFDKYNKPAYFSIFKFISSFIPLKPQNAGKTGEALLQLCRISFAVSLLRAPPAGE
jgi:hypothetical protein